MTDDMVVTRIANGRVKEHILDILATVPSKDYVDHLFLRWLRDATGRSVLSVAYCGAVPITGCRIAHDERLPPLSVNDLVVDRMGKIGRSKITETPWFERHISIEVAAIGAV